MFCAIKPLLGATATVIIRVVDVSLDLRWYGLVVTGPSSAKYRLEPSIHCSERLTYLCHQVLIRRDRQRLNLMLLARRLSVACYLPTVVESASVARMCGCRVATFVRSNCF